MSRTDRADPWMRKQLQVALPRRRALMRLAQSRLSTYAGPSSASASIS